MRESFTEDNIHAVFELRAAGFGTVKIKGYTKLSESSIHQLNRAKKALVAGDYLQALREIEACKSRKLTDYSANKIWWICDANKIPKMSREELEEAWKTIVGETETPESANLFDSMSDEIPKGWVLKRETKSTRMQLLVTPTTADGIKAAADDQGISTNELVCRILDDYLAGLENSPIGWGKIFEETALRDMLCYIRTKPITEVIEIIETRIKELDAE